MLPKVNEEDIGPLCRFLAGISEDLPVCFLAFRPNYILEEHPGASVELMRRCLELAREAGLRNATWSGITGMPGRPFMIRREVAETYDKEGARVAASYARGRGCATHPRDCRGCPSKSMCRLKAFIPKTSC